LTYFPNPQVFVSETDARTHEFFEVIFQVQPRRREEESTPFRRPWNLLVKSRKLCRIENKNSMSTVRLLHPPSPARDSDDDRLPHKSVDSGFYSRTKTAHEYTTRALSNARHATSILCFSDTNMLFEHSFHKRKNRAILVGDWVFSSLPTAIGVFGLCLIVLKTQT
jgi:hypothetical protein